MDSRTPLPGYTGLIGLSHDPFATPVAEQELKRLQKIFYHYFVPPSSIEASQPLTLSALRQPQHAFIFGEPGSGKSTLRLTTEADCRTVFDGSVVVSYNLGDDFRGMLSSEKHGEHLSQAFALDFFVQVIEQFNALDAFPNETKIAQLYEQMCLAGPRLIRSMRNMMNAIQKKSNTDISTYWQQIGKSPVRYVAASSALLALMNLLFNVPPQTLIGGWESFWRSQQTARNWGFTRTLVLVDGVDARRRSPEDMLALLEPLLDILPQAQSLDVYFKFFLPLELQRPVTKLLSHSSPDLLSKSFFSIINWEQKALQQLLLQRFRAAGVRYNSMNALAEPGVELDAKILQAAQGSPRRMLEIVHQLLSAHSVRSDDSTTKLNDDDWAYIAGKWTDV